MLTPLLDLTDFLKVGGGTKPKAPMSVKTFNPDDTEVTPKDLQPDYTSESTTHYALRGLITFYGLHYIAYFYSAKFDTWYQFNDASIKQIGSFKDVRDRCIAGMQRPTTLFYERTDIIVNVLKSQDYLHSEK